MPYLTGMRTGGNPATAYRAYRSKPVTNPKTTTWVQLDLTASTPIDAIQLFPASERMYPGRDQYDGGEGFLSGSASTRATILNSASPK